MYKNLCDSEDSNVKKINFGLRYKVSQGITRNGSDVHIDYRRTEVGQKAFLVSGANCGIRSDEYQKFKYHRYIQTNTS